MDRLTDTAIPRLEAREAKARLDAYGISPTPQRVEIAAVLLAHPQHLSAEQLLGLVNQRRPLVSKATVYNTLGLLARSGLVREVVVDPTKVFYDSNTLPHHHFYNVSTGHLSDIEADEITVGSLPEMPEGTVVEGVDVIVRLRSTASS